MTAGQRCLVTLEDGTHQPGRIELALGHSVLVLLDGERHVAVNASFVDTLVSDDGTVEKYESGRVIIKGSTVVEPGGN